MQGVLSLSKRQLRQWNAVKKSHGNGGNDSRLDGFFAAPPSFEVFESEVLHEIFPQRSEPEICIFLQLLFKILIEK